MTKVNEVYRCPICGNVIEVTSAGGGELVCCGKPMRLMKENSEDAAVEKHVPVVEKTATDYVVKVGSTEHPMTAEHFIEWVELISGDKVYRQNLKPGEKPEAAFNVSDLGEVTARAYCNLHGLWKK